MPKWWNWQTRCLEGAVSFHKIKTEIANQFVALFEHFYAKMYKNGKYYYNNGFNLKAILAWVISGYIAIGSVWPKILPGGLGDFFANLGGGGGYAWMIGAGLGAIVHYAISSKKN